MISSLTEERTAPSPLEFLKFNANYQIEVNYPHRIFSLRRKRFIAECLAGKGYYQVQIEGKYYYKHRVIAAQWKGLDIHDRKQVVDHFRHDKMNNILDNLIVGTSSSNNHNKTSSRGVHYTYLDELPPNTHKLLSCNGAEINIIYCNPSHTIFYDITTGRPRIMHVNWYKGHPMISITIEGKHHIICINSRKCVYSAEREEPTETEETEPTTETETDLSD
jgi:hypothetical protein